MNTTKYPDSVKGAVGYLMHAAPSLDYSNIGAIPDPFVKGVWKVDNIGTNLGFAVEAVVYLAGYLDSFGRLRKHNTHEIGL
jgi:hypothetical protein